MKNIFAPTPHESANHWLTKISQSSGTAMAKAKKHGEQGSRAVAMIGEGALTAAGLAAINVYRNQGLDMRVGKGSRDPKTGVTKHMSVPIDGALAAVGIVASIVAHPTAPNEASHILNVGSAAATVWAFRKSQEFMAKSYAKKNMMAPGYTLQDGHRELNGQAPLSDAELKAAKEQRAATLKGLKDAAKVSGDYYDGSRFGSDGFGAEGLTGDPILEAAKGL
jgi:hypothetical protein